MTTAMGTKSYMNLHVLSYLYANFHDFFIDRCTIKRDDFGNLLVNISHFWAVPFRFPLLNVYLYLSSTTILRLDVYVRYQVLIQKYLVSVLQVTREMF